jgi:hypothetical protein
MFAPKILIAATLVAASMVTPQAFAGQKHVENIRVGSRVVGIIVHRSDDAQARQPYTLTGHVHSLREVSWISGRPMGIRPMELAGPAHVKASNTD